MGAKQVEAFFEFRLITSALLILLTITGSLGRLTDVPKNNFMLEGARVVFTCCSDEHEPLFWKVKYISSSSMTDIYDAGLVNGFRNNGRFNVTGGSRSGCYRLIIAGIKVGDAGTYYCVDHQGLGQQKEWELVILENFDCQEKNRKAEYMGENKFGLPEDVFSTACVYKYFGNIPPKLICGWSSGTQIFDNHQHFTESSLTTTMTIQMPARKEFNGDQLFCYLKIGGKASDNQATTAWKSSQLIINYASFHQRGVSQCSVDELQLDCQPPCNYKAVEFSNGSSYCEITYPNKTHQTFFVSLQDTCNSTTNLPVENQAHSTVILLVVTLVPVLTCICGALGATAATIIILKRKRRQRRKMAKPEVIPLVTDCNRAFRIMDLSTTPSTPFSEPGNVSVRGFAILGEYLFFAYRDSSQVRVYSANTLGYKTSWALNEITKPQDLTACSENNCLYISNIKLTNSEYIKQTDSEYIELTDREYIEITDSGYFKLTDSECNILKISPQGCLIETWNTGINHFGRLSVTHDFNVLMAVHYNHTLVEYTTDGTRLNKIHLPDTLRPIYALKVSPDCYFVSYGFNEDLEHGVCNVDAHGQVLKRFGNTKGSTNQQLNNPAHLVMNDESIWVTDSKNGRVVALSHSLEYQATLLSKEDELSCPQRICIDHNNRRFLLSDLQNQNHLLRVFNFI